MKKGEEKIKVLKFENPEFHEGLNFTVRKGYTWKDCEIGEIVRVPDCKDKNLAVVKKIYVVPFLEIPQEVYNHNHDKNCQHRAGLETEMRKHYHNFSIRDNVTCLGFMRV